MSPKNELLTLTQSYHKWIKKKFHLRPFIPCKLELSQTKIAPIFAIKKELPPPPRRLEAEPKLVPSYEKKKVAPPKIATVETEDRFKKIREDFKSAYPQIILSEKPLEDTRAYQAIQEASLKIRTHFYFFIPEKFYEDAFYNSVLKALSLHEIPFEKHFETNFQELAFASIPSSLKAIFVPSTYFTEAELTKDHELMFNCIKKQHGVALYALYPPEYYTSTSKNKVRLWKTISSFS